MNNRIIKYCFLSILVLYFLPLQLFSQNSAEQLSAGDELYKLVEQKYGIDEILVNGRHFDNLYVHDLGHPYFGEDTYKKGYLLTHKQKYKDLLLKYNIFDQTLVVQYVGKENSQTEYLPPVEFISEFSFENHKFKKYDFPKTGERFFEEVYVGEISCLCLWRKTKDKSEHNVTFMAHKYSDSEKKYFLLMEDVLYSIKNKSALLKLFPEHKTSISQFIKANKIKLYKSPDDKVSELIAYCESLRK